MLSRRKTYAGRIKHPVDATEPATLDPLSSIAPLFRARPEIQGVCRFALQWEVVHEAEPGFAQFHIVRGKILDFQAEYEGSIPFTRSSALHPSYCQRLRGIERSRSAYARAAAIRASIAGAIPRSRLRRTHRTRLTSVLAKSSPTYNSGQSCSFATS